jgi:DNA-binding beta-propeller fold protein YncE/predicted GH43/DUF377 family glycosyl hydrolase
VLILALLAGCIRDAPLPDLGPCAEYPAGVYEYGQVGIGTCLAGPTELEFSEDPDGNSVLLVTNANPYQVFTGGSLLSIPWDAIDLSLGRAPVHTLGATALDMPTFAGALAVDGDLGMVAVRLSDEARVRQTMDDVHLVDLSDPSRPKRSTRGTDGGSTIQVRADPVDIVTDPASGLTFVANRTSHSISILDTSGEEIKIVRPWPTWALSSAEFDDVDDSGSRAELSTLEVINPDEIRDDEWTLTWVEGTFRLWMPGTDGLSRATTTLAAGWYESPLGVELDPSTTGSTIEEVRDPHYESGRMFFADRGNIRAAIADAALTNWGFEAQILLSPRTNGWDTSLGGPSVIEGPEGLYLFYDGGGQDSAGIGAALSADGVNFARTNEGAPLLEPAEGEIALADPYIFADEDTDQYRMFLSTWDGARWAIAHATSEDLNTWTLDETFALELPASDAAAPVVARVQGAWHLWYAHRDADTWVIAEATSPDGRTWTDQGPVDDLAAFTSTDTEPPGPALQAALTSAFRVEGADAGIQSFPAVPGVPFGDSTGGWLGMALAGYQLGPGDAGADSSGGLRVDAVDLDSGRAWLTLTDAAGNPSVGVATIDDDGTLLPDSGAIYSGTAGAFDRHGAESPVVAQIDGVWHLYYAGIRDDAQAIGLLTSTDGETWTPQGKVFGTGSGFDVGRVAPGSIEPLDDGRVRLWYSGFDGAVWRIGSAVSSNGRSFTRESSDTHDYRLGTGSPGQWHDSGVRDPWIVAGTNDDGVEGVHAWFSGFDGDLWRIGYAFRPTDGDQFELSTNAVTLEPRPVVNASGGLFHPNGVERPVMVQDDLGWTGWYAGLSSDGTRVGALSGAVADRLATRPERPSVGDTITFSTQRGDPDADAIPLDVVLPQGAVSGIGLTSLTIDEERGFLYAVSKLLGYFVVIDIRDDSGPAFLDQNYLDIEAVLPFDSGGGAQGFRQIVPVPGTDRLYALNDQPEAIWVLDMSSIEDEPYAHIEPHTVVGWLPAPRGLERDEGASSQTSVGPAQLVVHPDGRRLFLTNFNANSVTVYDLELGPHGQQVAEVSLVGESPYGLVLSPDARHAVIGNFTGEVNADGFAQATLAILDIDVSSPTYLQVLTWVVNR